MELDTITKLVFAVMMGLLIAIYFKLSSIEDKIKDK